MTVDNRKQLLSCIVGKLSHFSASKFRRIEQLAFWHSFKCKARDSKSLHLWVVFGEVMYVSINSNFTEVAMSLILGPVTAVQKIS